MNHAVIFAHPRSDSLTAAIAARCATALKALGHQAVVRDLYAMDFDPRLKAQEVPTIYGYQPAPDTLAEREILRDIESFIFVYPFWFNGPPAILKGYVDRVFGLGFGSAPHVGVAEPLLEGRRLYSFTTSGAPEHWVQETGALQALMTNLDYHLAGVCGLSVVGHHHIGGIVPGITEESVDDVLAEVEAAVGAAFTAG